MEDNYIEQVARDEQEAERIRLELAQRYATTGVYAEESIAQEAYVVWARVGSERLDAWVAACKTGDQE